MNLYLNVDIEVKSNYKNEYQIYFLTLLNKYINNTYNTYYFVY